LWGFRPSLQGQNTTPFSDSLERFVLTTMLLYLLERSRGQRREC
jgi:hypothetical protein